MAILDLLYHYRGNGVEVATIAEIVYEAPEGTFAYQWDAAATSRREAVRRALRHLRRLGAVSQERQPGRKVAPAPHPALRALQPEDLYVKPSFTYRLTDSCREALQRVTPN